MKYDAVISIGGACEVAYQLRKFTGVESANIFDWWITPFEGLVAVVESDFRDLFVAENMVIMSGRSVICKKYGIVHHHDFRRNSDGYIVSEEIPARLEELTTKYNMLCNRLRAACAPGQNVLFVRGWLDRLHEKRSSAQEPDRSFDFERLISVFENRFPSANLSFLFANYGMDCQATGGVAFDNVRDAGDKLDWRGSSIGWQEMLSRHVQI